MANDDSARNTHTLLLSPPPGRRATVLIARWIQDNRDARIGELSPTRSSTALRQRFSCRMWRADTVAGGKFYHLRLARRAMPQVELAQWTLTTAGSMCSRRARLPGRPVQTRAPWLLWFAREARVDATRLPLEMRVRELVGRQDTNDASAASGLRNVNLITQAARPRRGETLDIAPRRMAHRLL